MKILLVGVGGYGAEYAEQLLNCKDKDVVFEGIVEPYFSVCVKKSEIEEAGIPVYATMDEFYLNHRADLAVICTPPFLHCEQSICALKNGSYVLCEKPVAPTVAEASRMADAEIKYGKWIAIGYQWSYSRAILDLKADILSGKLGKAISFKTLISWPRDRKYYARGGGWGGKIFRNGALILDSVASNACAHYLHNMLFLLGSEMSQSACITELSGDCMRANEIENFDTCSLKLKTKRGTPLYFIASHAAKKFYNPEFEYVFEKGTVIFSEDKDSLIHIKFSDGSEKIYGNPFADLMEKLWICADAVRNGETPVCTVKTATPHTELIERIWREISIAKVPDRLIRSMDKADGIYVEGLYEAMMTAYEKNQLLSEAAPKLFDKI